MPLISAKYRFQSSRTNPSTEFILSEIEVLRTGSVSAAISNPRLLRRSTSRKDDNKEFNDQYFEVTG